MFVAVNWNGKSKPIFNVKKQRNGALGTVTMRLRGECYRFEELADGYE